MADVGDRVARRRIGLKILIGLQPGRAQTNCPNFVASPELAFSCCREIDSMPRVYSRQSTDCSHAETTQHIFPNLLD